MRNACYFVLGAGLACAAAFAIVHRRVIAAVINGDPIPEPPEWHKGHPCMK